MTMRRAAPGPQLGGGRLRVDAARAIAKLREYQLADRADWVLEGLRAAVASAATRIELRGDANDIWLAWEGHPWDPALLPRLFDELVSPEAAAELQHVRLLAGAVNSALGLEPAYVDVYSISAARTAHRVRYTPEVLDADNAELDAADPGAPALRQVEVSVAVPPTAIERGMLVHLRRRASLEVLGYLFGEPPELPNARDACRDIPVELAVGNATFHRDRHDDVVRVPIGDGVDGFVAITRSLRDPAIAFEVAERGVLLACYPVLLPFSARADVPLRVHLDAERLPTNASRSQVRCDVHPISTVERRMPQLIARAVAELAAQVSAGSTVARDAALSLLAADIGGQPQYWNQVSSLLAPLARLPLLANAFGERRGLDTPWRPEVYTGSAVLEVDLAEWLGEVLWIRDGDAARRLLGPMAIDRSAMRRHASWARQQRRARKRFLAHATRPLRVQSAATPRIRVPLGVRVDGSCVSDDIIFEGMRGEVCVYASGKDAALALLLDGRELEHVEVTSAIPFDAVIEGSDLTPGANYRGVVRDAAFAAVQAALHAGVLRALEAFAAILGGAAIDQAELGGNVDVDLDLALVRRGLVLAKQLGYQLSGPLTEVAAWPLITGTRARYRELEAVSGVGMARPDVAFVAPAKRPVVLVSDTSDAELLRSLFGARLVSYSRTGARQRTPEELAQLLAPTSRSACIAFELDGASAAVALAGHPSLQLFHVGAPLDQHSYNWKVVRCAIAIDSPAIVPNAAWSAARDDAGLAGMSYREWELALLRAIAASIAGGRSAQLVSPASIAIDDENGRALARAIWRHGPSTVLGDELLARFEATPLFTLLGLPGLHSANDLARMFPDEIPRLDRVIDPTDGFTPLVADEDVARLAEKLCKRPWVDAGPIIKRRLRDALFRARYAAHLAKPPDALELPEAPCTVTVRGTRCKGIVGVSGGGFELRVHVAGRLFDVIRPAGAYPLVAAIEIPPSECGSAFEEVPPTTADALVQEVLAHVPALLEQVARTQPEALGRPGPTRTLLACWLDGGKLPRPLRELLCSVPAMPTVQGGWIALAEVVQPRLVVTVAAWNGDWLPPAEGEAESALDAPIIALAGPKDELREIVDQLHPYAVDDVTIEVARLQARRGMARGLVPMPRLPTVAATAKRELKGFGALSAKLGHGEIGLVPGIASTVFIHEHGQLKRSIGIDVLPAIGLAVEEPHEHYTFDALRTLAQQLALELVRVLTTERGRGNLPSAYRRSHARALLANRIPPAVISDEPLFLTTDGAWKTWKELATQIERFGDVWAVTPPHDRSAAPLDPDRLVILLEADDIALAAQYGHPIINAKLELELDAKARENRARPRARDLELPSRDGVLAEVALDGDGVTAPRGTVAVLDPSAAEARGMHVHRALHPLERVADVCAWPSLTILDDARITPDRTWAAPVRDETWQAIAKQVRAASEQALATLGEVPGDALASLRVTNQLYTGMKSLRGDAIIRGALWLTGMPYGPAAVVVHHAGGMRSFVPYGGLAIAGWLAVYAQRSLSLDEELDQLCRIAHGRLVRALMKDADADPDVVAAHVAHAIASTTLRPTESQRIEFPCFVPAPLNGRGLASLMRALYPVPLVKPGTQLDPGVVGFVDDGSKLAGIVRVHLGDRLTRSMPARAPRFETPPPRPASPPVSERRPAAAIAVATPAPERPHPLRPLQDALVSRLGQLGIRSFRWDISESLDTPTVIVSGDYITLCGANHQLRAIGRALVEDTAAAAPALDALAAHVVSLLNIRRTDITDTNEAHALGVLLAGPRAKRKRK